MKWSDLYSGISLRSQEEQPDCDLTHYFLRMSEKGGFVFDIQHDLDETGNAWCISPVPLTFNILKVVVGELDISGYFLEMTCKTTGQIPPGVKSGTYTLLLRGGDVCLDLPVEMFEDGEVPDSELSSWSRFGS